MSWFRLRPTFEIYLAEARSTAIEKLEAQCMKVAERNRFLMHGEYGELHLPPSEHRLWSPHLSFYVSERDDVCLIHGRFAPRLEMWTFVWVVYLFMAFSAFYGFALAYSQWMLSEPSWGLWVAATALLAILVLYVVAHVGQQWSSDQMTTLRMQLDDILHDGGVRQSALATPATLT